MTGWMDHILKRVIGGNSGKRQMALFYLVLWISGIIAVDVARHFGMKAELGGDMVEALMWPVVFLNAGAFGFEAYLRAFAPGGSAPGQAPVDQVFDEPKADS